MLLKYENFIAWFFFHKNLNLHILYIGMYVCNIYIYLIKFTMRIIDTNGLKLEKI